LNQHEREWEAVVQEHQTAVFRLAYLFCGDPDEAEDVTQDTFIRAYRAIEKFDRSRPMRPWLLGIAANLARNHLRGLGRYLAALQRLVRGEAELIPTTDPLSDPVGDARSVWQAIHKMSLADQQVIYLRFYLELSEAETSVVLRIPTGTVKSRLSRAMARLRDRLEGLGEPKMEVPTRE
jgi:RNA polymerase sigma-70 factor (ECF subfamily)